MSFLIGFAHLSLHRVACQDEDRPGLSGILIDPVRGVATASDGKRLVEITAPKLEKFPAGCVALANGEAKPFILSAASARELLKGLVKSKTPTDPAQFAALAAVKSGEKPRFVIAGGKVVACEAVDATFPEYHDAGIFPKEKPANVVVMNAQLLRDTLAAVALGDSVTIESHKNRLVITSQKDDGSTSRAVIMGFAKAATASAPESTKSTAKTAAVPKVEPPAPEQDEEEIEEDVDSPPAHAAPPQARYRRFKHRYARPVEGSTGSNGGPSDAQRAFHLFLIRSRGGEISLDDLTVTDVAAKIDELKAQPAVEETFATWPQWRKLYFLLLSAKASAKVVCETLNDLTEIKETSTVIADWIGKAPAQAAA